MAEQKTWAWQPFGGLSDDCKCFTLIGNHYRGFPVIKITDDEKRKIEREGRFSFEYKGVKYVFSDGEVITAEEDMKRIIANHNRILEEMKAGSKF